MVRTQGNIPDGRCGRRASRGRWGGVAIAVVVAGWGLWQPGFAGAATSGTTLQYTCTVGAPMTARVAWHLPPRIVVGRPTPAVSITVAATVTATNTALFEFAGVASIDGRGEAAGVIAAPQGTVDTALHLVVAHTPVPASGPMTFHAAGTLPVPVLRRPGRAVFDVGTALDLTLTPRDANGSPTFNSIAEPCTLNPGQDRELFSFAIRPVPSATPKPGTSRVGLPPAPVVGTPGRGSSGPGAAGAGGSRSSTGSSNAADPAASNSRQPTTLTPASITATSGPARDSAAVSNRRRRPSDWWLSVVAMMTVVLSTVGGVRWLRNRRRAPGG